MSFDDGVQATNCDATKCKYSAVKMGYWQDDFIQYFVTGYERKTPEINRGYYARIKGVAMFMDKFLKKTGSNCQIINLGAGFDTLYWRLKNSGIRVNKYIEIDFASVTSKKCFLIKKSKILLQTISPHEGEVKIIGSDLHAPDYHIIGIDLRNLTELDKKLTQCGINFDIPTMFLTECVLVYMEPESSSMLLHWIAKKFNDIFFINYEQVNMNDNFGRIMLDNLRNRGCQLAGVDACLSPQTQMDRFVRVGWDSARSWNMINVYEYLPEEDRYRIERLEMLDELELLQQLLQHYCITIAWKGITMADVDHL
ncbi:leucine carboxyl methyltransferase 1 [Acyrthosiphon pisum]|uniref:Leucine carboxyl methyltransferase 1 n=1 Tax=Acyrthosiphon pisum TaxID=7029 RepID=A0A8R1W7B1_ACYPI|nr:leucine carboxyl methyltransferase 1 [Acyrthosiphon pisum]XP_016661943.1 leucine carboxyl methyltransferase 1 [Acyrthosiphon pisum]|eukprot:XP_001951404.1 PREDICTED: leucine carboxyl methyltransferase 1 [Acyrthosiphon pisum]